MSGSHYAPEPTQYDLPAMGAHDDYDCTQWPAKVDARLTALEAADPARLDRRIDALQAEFVRLTDIIQAMRLQLEGLP